MKEGRFVHNAPKGYKPGRDESNKPVIVPNADAPFVQEAFMEVAKGIYSLNEVLSRLMRKGFRCSKNQFGLMLRNPVYKGVIHIPPYGDEPELDVLGLHQPLVSAEDFDRVQEVLDQRKGNRHCKPAKRHEDLPLRGHLLCPRCGRHISGSPVKVNGGRYYYNHCQKDCKERFRADEANARFISYLEFP